MHLSFGRSGYVRRPRIGHVADASTRKNHTRAVATTRPSIQSISTKYPKLKKLKLGSTTAPQPEPPSAAAIAADAAHGLGRGCDDVCARAGASCARAARMNDDPCASDAHEESELDCGQDLRDAGLTDPSHALCWCAQECTTTAAYYDG